MWHDNETDNDLLGFEIHSSLIKEIVLDPKMLPISIGLFGDWGSGKSSILKMLEKELRGQNKVVVIKFNGWVFEGYDDAKSALIETILKSLSKHEKVSSKGKKLAKNLLGKVDLLRLGKVALKNFAIPAAKAYATGGLSLIGDSAVKIAELLDKPEEIQEKLNSEEGKSLQEEFKSVIKSEGKKKKTPDVVRSFRKQFEKTIVECKVDALVIMVDDLDRCSPDRIIDNLEAIKLFLNVERTAFVIGADPRIVRHAIQHKYKAKDVRDSEIEDYNSLVTDYLEKFIQVPYSLPKLSDTEVETYLSLLFCQNQLTDDQFNSVVSSFQRFRIEDRHSTFGFKKIEKVIGSNVSLDNLSLIPTLAPLITEGLKGNPRQIKRFLNAYVIRKKLADVAKIKDFRDDVLIKLMILEYVNFDHFQELYKFQIESSGYPQLLADAEKAEDLSKFVDKFSNWDKPGLRKWIKTNPQLHEVDLRDYFWISRDKISVSLTVANLVPPIVKTVYSGLIEINSNSMLEKEINSIEETLESDEYIEKFSTLVNAAIINEPAKKVNHDIMLHLLNKHPVFLNDYLNALDSISVKSLPPSAGSNLILLENKGIDISRGIEILEKDKKSRAFKSYSTKKK